MAGNTYGAGHSPRDKSRLLFVAMIFTATFMVVEVIGGLISGSLALLADATHMLTDAAALGLAWGATRVAAKPADAKRSYGYERFQVLAAFTNGLALLVLVGWIFVEAIHRIAEPPEILAVPMLLIASLGLLVNIAIAALLRKDHKHDMNVEGAFLHVMSDLLGSVATIIAGLVIYFSGWTLIDPILSILVGFLILRAGWALVRRAAHILLEGTPESLDLEALKSDLIERVPGLTDLHHIHVWLLTTERPLMTMHATIADGTDPGPVLLQIKSELQENFGISHSTVQIENGACADDHFH
jgi:cobalt-zinc-cadmium efflux system protein